MPNDKRSEYPSPHQSFPSYLQAYQNILLLFYLNLGIELQNYSNIEYLSQAVCKQVLCRDLCLRFHLLLLLDFQTEMQKAHFCPQSVSICTRSIWLFIRIRTSKTTAILLRTTKYLLVNVKYNLCEADILVNQFDQQVCTICIISQVLLTIAIMLTRYVVPMQLQKVHDTIQSLNVALVWCIQKVTERVSSLMLE